MYLKIVYKSGEVRILRPTSDFFTSTTVDKYDKKLKAMVKSMTTPSEKAVAIAEDCGADPYTIYLERNGQVELDKVIRANAPVDSVSYTIDERKIKKQLRHEYKNIPFTSRQRLQF